jgi:subtilisin family serine protease
VTLSLTRLRCGLVFVVAALLVVAAVPTAADAWPSLPQALRAGGGATRLPAEHVSFRTRHAPGAGRLSSELAALQRVRTDPDAALARPWKLNVPLVSGGVRVVIETGRAGQARRAVDRLGGRVAATRGGLVEALVPPAALGRLSRNPAVRFVRRPARRVGYAVGGEEIAASLASVWHAKGVTGKGVKIGIVDLGFQGYADRQASGELPANLVAVDYCSGRLAADEPHGTAVAEIVHEMAPDAQLYLICIDSDLSLWQAVTYAKSQGIQIVNYSIGTYNDGRGDGTGVDGAVVADARANGILWVAAAGNDALTHWTGSYVDANGNGAHDWTSTSETNSFLAPNGAEICGFLRWDEWPVAASDFDLVLFSPASGAAIAVSDGEQTGTQPPLEGLCVVNGTGTTQQVAWVIVGYRVVSAPRIDLFTIGPPLQYSTAAGSIGDPAASPSAFAVGALCWSTNILEPYSSQGPTIDGRRKPDIVGHDSVSGATYGPYSLCPSAFAGTSAAAPEVAGAAALVKQTHPTFGPNELQAFLEKSALDLAPAGKDDQTGAGRLRLPALADKTPPRATALASRGRHGTTINLRSRASDDSGQLRVREQVLRGTKVVARLSSPFTAAATATEITVAWHAPARLTGTLRHCVTAVDKAGNASTASCAQLVVR